MEAKEIRKELEKNYGYTFLEKDEWQFNFIMGLITDVSEVVRKNALLAGVSERMLGIESCANLIKSMPLDQAIQIIKSDITKLPSTQVINGELVVAYVR